MTNELEKPNPDYRALLNKSLPIKTSYIDFSGANFRGIKIPSGLDFTGSVFEGALFDLDSINSILRSYKINSLSMQGIDLSKQTLSYEILDSSEIGIKWKAKLKFDYWNLSESNFAGSTLDSVVFFNADLSGCNFQNAKLINVDFTMANLENCDFRGSNVEAATLMNAVNYDKAMFDQKNFAKKIENAISASKNKNRLRNFYLSFKRSLAYFFGDEDYYIVRPQNITKDD